MILYQALSSYQILECMIHRQVFYKDKKCILILGTYIRERMPNFWELETKGFFDEVYLFRFGGYRGSEDEIIRQVDEEIKISIPYDLEKFEKILAAGIHTYLQVYMIFRGIPFEMFEDGSGALSRPWILADIHKKSAPDRYELIEKYGLYDHQNAMITKKYCDMKAQEKGFYDKKAEDFQVMEQFHNLPDQKKQDIRHIFALPLQKGEEDSVLLLTQQFANLGQLPYDGQIDIYRHLFTYYLRERKVIIKPHPDDILYYHRLFGQAEVIREPFPSELLPLVFDKMPCSVCTVSSTGVNQIRGEFKEHIILGPLYESSYIYDSLYYTALLLADYLGIYQIYSVGVNTDQIRYMAALCPEFAGKFSVSQEKTEGKYLCLIGDVEKKGREQIEKEASAEGILYLNERKEYQMKKFDDLLPVSIWEGEKHHTIFFWSRKGEMRKMASEFSKEIKLPYLKDEIVIEKLNEDQTRIQMLEGILEATERRLLEYIRREKELKKKIADLEGKVKRDVGES